MAEEIKKVDGEHLVVITTNVNEQLIAKKTLEAEKAALQEKIAEIDEKLKLFN
jgi:hypothetical protein